MVPQLLELCPFHTKELAVNGVTTLTIAGERVMVLDGALQAPLINMARIYFVPAIMPMALAAKVEVV